MDQLVTIFGRILTVIVVLAMAFPIPMAFLIGIIVWIWTVHRATRIR